MITCVKELEETFYTGSLYPVIYKTDNLIVKTLGPELIIMYQFYIIISYNRDSGTKRMFIYDMNEASKQPSKYNGITFTNNELTFISFYLDYQNGKVLPSSESKIKSAFSKIFKLKAFF